MSRPAVLLCLVAISACHRQSPAAAPAPAASTT